MSEPAPDYTAAQIDHMEAIWGGGFKRARAALGVTAFGMSVSDLPPNYDRVPAHIHTFDGQEEIYLPLAGGGRLEINGERVPIDRETIVRVGPGAVRRPIAGPQGLRLLSVGAIPGQAYEPFPNSIAGAPEPKVADMPGVRAVAGAESVDDFTALAITEMDSPNGFFYRARVSLGISSFGMSVIDFAGDAEFYPRHDESSTGQEEVYTVLAGSGELRIGDDDHVALEPGLMVRVGPGTMRKISKASDGMRLLTLGGTPGAAYEPPVRAKSA